MLDRHHLMILREVGRLGSVTAAGEKLNVTQSALSHMIRKIEDHYGVEIWQRKGRSLRFTEAGKFILALAQRVLPQIEHAERVLADFSAGKRGALRIGMECHPCQKWLMRITPEYLAAWPDVSYEVRTGFRFDGVAALQDHEIDLLITPDPIDLPELLFFPIIDYQLALVVHEKHRLAQQEWIKPHDLLEEELLTVPVSIERLDIFTHFLIPAQCRPKCHRTVESSDLMLQLVAAKRGVAVLPNWLIDDEGADLPLRMLRLGQHGISKSINIGIRRGEEHMDYIAGFLSLAHKFGYKA